MLKNYKLLETNTHEKIAIAYYHPDTVDVISLETPALEVLTDFHTTRPRIIEKNVLADQALSQMQQHKVHALLVVDENDQVIGLINAARVQGVYKTQVAQQQGIRSKDVTVEMLMTKIDTLKTLQYNAVKNALVGHIARLLHESNTDHMLVYSLNKNKVPVIRGIFSAGFISRRLSMAIGSDLGSSSLAEMNKII